MATPEVKVSLNLEGKEAVKLLNGIQDNLERLGKTGAASVKKTDLAIGNMVGTLGALAAVKAFDFLKQQMIDSFDTFVQYEAGLINVAKTANLTAQEVDELADEILKMSKEIPASTDELLSIATAAGQLGVTGVKSISNFTSTIAKLGRVSDLSGDAAATTLTRILNVSGESIDSIDEFSSVLVSLGNNFAATESEIASMANEVVRATSRFGVSASEAAALSASLRSMGIRAEEAGGVLTKSFVQIQDAISQGGTKMAALEKITGKTGEQIKNQFSKDAIGFFRDFVQGLNTAEGGLKNASRNLATLGIEGIRVQKVLPVLAANIGEFDRALGLANAEMGNSFALTDEYEKSLKSTASQTQLMVNALERLRIKIGGGLADALNAVAPKITELVDNAAKSKIELFADGTTDLKVLNKELEIYEKKLAVVQGGNPIGDFSNGIAAVDVLSDLTTGLQDLIKHDPAELNANMKVLRDRILEVEDTNASATLMNLRTELLSLNEQAKNQDPLLASIIGDTKAVEERKATVIEQIANIEQAQILSGQRVVEAKKAQGNAEGEDFAKKLTFMQELKAAADIADQENLDIETEENNLKFEEDLRFLEEHLGAKAAARELHRIKEIEDGKKRNAELKKLQLKAMENEKVAGLFSIEFERKVGKEKVAAQKATLGNIAGLQASSNGALFEVGKAAAVTMAYINTQQAVTSALANVPYPFNFAAAVAVGAAGAINIANIAGASRPKASAGGFENGGIVGGTSFTGDNIQANVNSGEAILNKRQQTNLFNAVDNNNLGGGGGTNITINNPMVLSEDGVSNLIDEINDAIEFKNKELRTA